MSSIDGRLKFLRELSVCPLSDLEIAALVPVIERADVQGRLGGYENPGRYSVATTPEIRDVLESETYDCCLNFPGQSEWKFDLRSLTSESIEELSRINPDPAPNIHYSIRQPQDDSLSRRSGDSGQDRRLQTYCSALAGK